MLERYATQLDCTEINSSFYRSHRPETWTRWGSSVPAHFRFAVKAPRAMTHERRLLDCRDLIAQLVDETAGLGEKLAIILIQLPPSLIYEEAVAARFFAALAAATAARIVCEPRHKSWFDEAADAHLARLEVARVAADPARVPAAAEPGGWRGLSYWRLHGSPIVYRSAYDDVALDRIAALMARERGAAHLPWCIFDNTASSAATKNALDLRDRIAGHPSAKARGGGGER